MEERLRVQEKAEQLVESSFAKIDKAMNTSRELLHDESLQEEPHILAGCVAWFTSCGS